MGNPLVVKVNSQSVCIIPRPDKEVQLLQAEAVKNAVKAAQTAVTSAIQVTSMVAEALGPREFGKVSETNWLVRDRRTVADFYDIMLGCFRVPEPISRHDFEDYRRGMQHILKMLQAVSAGLATEGLAVSDLEPKFYKWNEKGEEEGTVAGYISPTNYQYLQMLLGSDFRRFWEEGHLAGPIHLNFSKLAGDSWEMTQTLIHEATHKFGRTWDNAYYHARLGKESPTVLKRARGTACALAKLTEKKGAAAQTLIAESVEGAVNAAPEVKGMTAVQALNNADSYAYYAMWLLT